MNKSISFAITETAARVKFMQEKGYKQRTIRLYLVQQKERHGITKVALKKFYKHKYGQELIIRR